MIGKIIMSKPNTTKVIMAKIMIIKLIMAKPAQKKIMKKYVWLN